VAYDGRDGWIGFADCCRVACKIVCDCSHIVGSWLVWFLAVCAAVLLAARTSYQIFCSCLQLFHILFIYFHFPLFFNACSVHFVRAFCLSIPLRECKSKHDRHAINMRERHARDMRERHWCKYLFTLSINNHQQPINHQATISQSPGII